MTDTDRLPDGTLNNGPHITVTDNILDVQLNENAKAVDFRFSDTPNPLSNGIYYNITGRTRQIKLIFPDNNWVILEYEGSRAITFTGQARLIVTGPSELHHGNRIRVDNYEGTNPAYFRELVGYLPPGPPDEDPQDGGTQ